MKQATIMDMERCVDILCAAFNENRGINWIVKNDAKREKRIRYLMEYSFKKYLPCDGVFVSDDGNGVIICSKTGGDTGGFSDTVKLLALVVRSFGIGRIGEVGKKDSIIKSKYPRTQFCNLIFIAVDPPMHGQGIGGSLLDQFLKKAREEMLPVCLETSTEKNIRFYEAHGFAIYDTWHNPYRDFPVWLMKREP